MIEQGTIVGGYRITRRLGAGGMGEVWEALDPRLGRKLAIKILPPHALSNPEALARFEREAKAASALNHPGIIHIYQIGEETIETEEIHFIAMELVEGETLRTKLLRATPPSELLSYCVEIAGTLSRAHSAGIIHRDLKPENVMITHDGFVKILDFGLAKLTTTESVGSNDPTEAIEFKTGSGMVMGTVGYMSPEQVQGKPADTRSDIFSFGCVLYECVTGKRPFKASTSVATMHAIAYEEPARVEEIAPDVSAGLSRIIGRTLQKKPEARYQSMAEVANDLCQDLAEVATAPTVFASPARERGPGGMAFGLGAIAAVVLVVLIAFMVMKFGGGSAVERLHSLRDYRAEKLTTSGNVNGLAISRDGRFAAIVQRKEGEASSSLSVVQISSGNAVEIVAAEEQVWIVYPAFAPDGESVYYVREPAGEDRASLYAVPTLGGRTSRQLESIDSGVAFSPEGGEYAFLRQSSQAGTSVVIREVGTSNERVLAELTGRPGEYIGPLWSPKGELVVAGRESSEVTILDADEGSHRTAGFPDWEVVSEAVFARDGTLIVGATGQEDGQYSFWYTNLETAETEPTPSDGYWGLAVALDVNRLLAARRDTRASLYRLTIGSESEPSPIGRGSSLDGLGGLSILPGGQIVFTSDGSLSIVSQDGSNRRLLATPPRGMEIAQPDASPNGKLVAYVVVGNRVPSEIRLVDVDGSVDRPVPDVPPDSSWPDFTPDGEFIVYEHDGDLWRVSVSGGPPERLTAVTGLQPRVSPDGDRFLLIRDGLVILPLSGGEPLARLGGHNGFQNVWSVDGQSILMNVFDSNGAVNLFRWNISEATRTQVSFLKTDQIRSFDVFPDGGTVAISRATVTTDVYVLSPEAPRATDGR